MADTIPPEPVRVCKRCGIAFSERTSGCMSCYHRHHRRNSKRTAARKLIAIERKEKRKLERIQREEKWRRINLERRPALLRNNPYLRFCDTCGIETTRRTPKCRACTVRQSVRAFHRNDPEKNKTRVKEWRIKNPERQREMSRNSYKANREKNVRDACERQHIRHRRIKQETFMAYGGMRCVCCGETEMRFLSLDHIAGNGNKHRKEIELGSDGKRRYVDMYYWAKKNGFPPGFRVLCMNCNFGTRYGQECPHQELQHYKDAMSEGHF